MGEVRAFSDGDVLFYAQQKACHRWAEDHFLSERDTLALGVYLFRLFDYQNGEGYWPEFIFEVPALAQPSTAVTVERERTGQKVIAFAGSGCDLLVLVHELAHAVRPWDEPHHDALDFDLASMMLEVVKTILEEEGDDFGSLGQ